MRTAFAPAKAFARGVPVRANVAVQRRGQKMVTSAKVMIELKSENSGFIGA